MRKQLETTIYACISCRNHALEHLAGTDLYFCPNVNCEDYFDISQLA